MIGKIREITAQIKTSDVGETLEPMEVFIAVFCLAAVAGVAPKLLADKSPKFRILFGTALYSGVIGIIVALIWWSYYGETQLFFLIGVSGLAGLGGQFTIGLAILYVKKKFNLEKLWKELEQMEKEDKDDGKTN